MPRHFYMKLNFLGVEVMNNFHELAHYYQLLSLNFCY